MKDEQVIVALFKVFGSSKNRLEVHSFNIANVATASDAKILKTFIEKFCPLQDYRNLDEEVQKIFSREYLSLRGLQMLNLYHDFENSLNFNYRKLTNKIIGCRGFLENTSNTARGFLSVFTKVLIHSQVLQMIKRVAKEQKIGIKKYIDHLIKDRAIVFSVDPAYQSIPRLDKNGKFIALPNNFRHEGISNYLSYSEMFLSTFLMVSSRTSSNDNNITAYTITIPEIASILTYNPFKDPYFVISKSKPSEISRIGKMFEDYLYQGFQYKTFDEIEPMTYEERSKRYIIYNRGELKFLDKFAYRRALRLTVAPFLLNANKIAKDQSKEAELYVGDWIGLYEIYRQEKISPGFVGHYNHVFKMFLQLFVSEFLTVARELNLQGKVDKIKEIKFYVYSNENLPVFETHGLNGIAISHEADMLDVSQFFNPNTKIKENRIVFASIQTKADSFPGKSFCHSSKEPFENASLNISAISDYQNPMINPEFTKNIVVIDTE